MFITPGEKRITAYHEAGHTLVARLLTGTDLIHKVTIIPCGMALGLTPQLPEDDRYHYPQSYLENRLAVAMGGRVAERVVFGEVSTGAQSDLKLVTGLAEKMVCQWGMSEKVGAMTFSRGEELAHRSGDRSHNPQGGTAGRGAFEHQPRQAGPAGGGAVGGRAPGRGTGG